MLERVLIFVVRDAAKACSSGASLPVVLLLLPHPVLPTIASRSASRHQFAEDCVSLKETNSQITCILFTVPDISQYKSALYR